MIIFVFYEQGVLDLFAPHLLISTSNPKLKRDDLKIKQVNNRNVKDETKIASAKSIEVLRAKARIQLGLT